MPIAYIGFSIASLLVVLGFVALLAQKIYLDSATQKPVELEVPFFGKMKANYPALVFVVLGAALAYTTIEKSFPPRKITWSISGTLKHPEHKGIDWADGSLALKPSSGVELKVFDQGGFEATIDLDEGKSLEDVIETLHFSHPAGSVCIDLKNELKNWKEGKPSLIAQLTEHTRTFKPVEIELYPPTEN